MLDHQQQAAVDAVRERRHRLACIVGPPGVGKTHAVRSAIEGREDVVLCAPTGKAACRLSELTGREATTIHRVLGMQPPANQRHRLLDPGSLVVCDESSMIGLDVADELLAAIRESGSDLLLVGDPGQLAPVGPGGLLHDAIRAGAPVYRLSTPHRSGVGDLLDLVQAVGLGLGWTVDNLTGGTSPARDVVVMRTRYPEAIARQVLDVTLRCDELGASWQVIAPSYRPRALGIDALNDMLQRAHGGPPLGIEAARAMGWERSVPPKFRPNDRVMSTRNHGSPVGYVANGEQGRVLAIDYPAARITVRWDHVEGLAHYDALADTDAAPVLAYAVSAHKSQGSEWEVVVIPWHSSYGRMLTRPWAYTAISRAKQRVVLVGDVDLVARAAKTPAPVRHSRVVERISHV